ncbi:hypothetical protein LCGC14_0888550 [marine sediment metagenome]|uniref:Uncharacterized protein n=1 Tax=marine sediment metagenome TaxID=412755 RepID=A0A0F9PKN4_9ZZZZ
MAKEKDIKLNILTPETRKELEKLGEQIDKSQKTLDLLKDLGLGVGDMQSKLDWSKKRKDILLERG